MLKTNKLPVKPQAREDFLHWQCKDDHSHTINRVAVSICAQYSGCGKGSQYNWPREVETINLTLGTDCSSGTLCY